LALLAISLASPAVDRYTVGRNLFTSDDRFGAAAMRRATGLFVVLLGVSGCAGDTAALWDPALKDLRGDNQQMRTLQGGSWGSELPKGTMSADH